MVSSPVHMIWIADTADVGIPIATAGMCGVTLCALLSKLNPAPHWLTPELEFVITCTIASPVHAIWIADAADVRLPIATTGMRVVPSARVVRVEPGPR